MTKTFCVLGMVQSSCNRKQMKSGSRTKYFCKNVAMAWDSCVMTTLCCFSSFLDALRINSFIVFLPPAIQAELLKVKQMIKAQKDKEKAVYAKMFA